MKKFKIKINMTDTSNIQMKPPRQTTNINNTETQDQTKNKCNQKNHDKNRKFKEKNSLI